MTVLTSFLCKQRYKCLNIKSCQFLPHLTMLLKRYFLCTSSLFLFPEGGVVGDRSLCTEGSQTGGAFIKLGYMADVSFIMKQVKTKVALTLFLRLNSTKCVSVCISQVYNVNIVLLEGKVFTLDLYFLFHTSHISCLSSVQKII